MTELRFSGRAMVWAAAFLLAAPAAQGAAPPKRDQRVQKVPEEKLPFVTPIVAPLARRIAVSEAASVIAVGHSLDAPALLSFFRLDPQGQLLPGDPTPLSHPKPAAVAAMKTQVHALVMHPRYPLLYVWQDIPLAPPATNQDPALGVEFDHLLIYSVEESPPKLLLATCRGENFAVGVAVGDMALDLSRNRLYVPNMRQLNPEKKWASAIGWLALDPDGLPAFSKPGETAAPPVAATTPLDPAAAAQSRAARMAARDQAQAAGQPWTLQRTGETTYYTFTDYPAPYSYAVYQDRVLMAGHSGIGAWEHEQRLGRFGYFMFQPYIPYRYRLATHPTLPVAYVSYVTYDGRIVCMEHAEGGFTLVPRSVTFDNVVAHSPPVVMPSRKQVAVGAAGKILVADLDDQGWVKTSGTQMLLDAPKGIEGIAWSEKFGRLYVPVEKAAP